MGLPSFSREFLLQEVLARLLFGIFPGWWLDDRNPAFGSFKSSLEGKNMLTALDPGNVYGLLATPGVWIGAAVGIALIAASIWLRRTRIETAT